ncbi:hypothetical protein K493DRAFT_105565 [Basidiobolus meristosporus CBS 931.73]|uniref:F-box domain-containing protein n=1 Tax=Basidiobolus meristosporus CBS 931.73 TaxID=1314790 RepID=A0A1Y1YQ36_9FUNG|nr:hypothetical protein K493DRAFT_105565 [Basidiobolus meristosporus CBS 931.73]|eukprot:ORY00128.1 hypothetical protein K493DRAFT_105565 [Basidiobolus meristosporus CBS 931.73]
MSPNSLIERHHISPCYIARLPQEILDCILVYLREDITDLWSCCLVNRQWNRSSTPELWRTPVFSSQKAIRAFKQIVTTNIKGMIDARFLIIFNLG